MRAWSKTMGILALNSGESELAAVVRAETEGMGLQSILSDFCLVWSRSNQVRCNWCDWDGPSTRIRKSSTFSCWRSVGLASRSFGENSSLKNVRFGESERCPNYLGSEPLLRQTKACNWVPPLVLQSCHRLWEVQTRRRPILQMVTK